MQRWKLSFLIMCASMVVSLRQRTTEGSCSARDAGNAAHMESPAMSPMPPQKPGNPGQGPSKPAPAKPAPPKPSQPDKKK
jgi:hypothetical protein